KSGQRQFCPLYISNIFPSKLFSMDYERNRPLYYLTVGEFADLVAGIIGNATSGQKDTVAPSSIEEHFTIAECASFLRCSLVSVHSYKKKGMPYYRVGRKVLFRKSEVLE